MSQSSSPSGKSDSTPEEPAEEEEAEEEPLLELEAEELGASDEDSEEDEAGVWANPAGAAVGEGVGVGVGVEDEELWQASGGAWPLAHWRVPSAMPLQTSSALIFWPFNSYSMTVPAPGARLAW